MIIAPLGFERFPPWISPLNVPEAAISALVPVEHSVEPIAPTAASRSERGGASGVQTHDIAAPRTTIAQRTSSRDFVSGLLSGDIPSAQSVTILGAEGVVSTSLFDATAAYQNAAGIEVQSRHSKAVA